MFGAGTKFACSSGAKTIAVSRLDTSQGSDWYVSKLIKGHKSTVSKTRLAIGLLTTGANRSRAAHCNSTGDGNRSIFP